MVLSDGSRIPTRTLVWTAGVPPHPLAADAGLVAGRGAARRTASGGSPASKVAIEHPPESPTSAMLSTVGRQQGRRERRTPDSRAERARRTRAIPAARPPIGRYRPGGKPAYLGPDEILAVLRRGDRSTGDLAERFPMTRPAVSRHLRVLYDAGLVDRKERLGDRECR